MKTENIYCPKCASKQQGNDFCSKCGNQLDVKNKSILGLKTVKETSAKSSKNKGNSVDEIQQKKEDNKTSKAKNILIFIKKYIYVLLKIPFQILLIYITGTIFLVLTFLLSTFFSISLAPTYIDSYGSSNLTFNGWLVFFVGQLLFLYPYRRLKLIYAEFFSVICASMILKLLIDGDVYVHSDNEIILLFSLYTSFLILYYEKTYDSYKLKKIVKIGLNFISKILKWVLSKLKK